MFCELRGRRDEAMTAGSKMAVEDVLRIFNQLSAKPSLSQIPFLNQKLSIIASSPINFLFFLHAAFLCCSFLLRVINCQLIRHSQLSVSLIKSCHHPLSVIIFFL